MILDVLNLVAVGAVFYAVHLMAVGVQECFDRLRRLEDLALGWEVDSDRIKAQKAEEERLIREEWERKWAKKLELLRMDPNRPGGGAVRAEMVDGKWKEISGDE